MKIQTIINLEADTTAARYTLDGTWTQNPYTTSEETEND